MKLINFKPESLQLFCNSQIYYINGVSLTEIRDNEKIILREGSICQLYVEWCSDTIRDKLLSGKLLTVIVDKFPRECKVRGRPALRFSVKSFEDADNYRQNDFRGL